LRSYLLAIITIMTTTAFVGSAHGVEPVRILAFGDSLTAGYGLAAEDGFTVQLQQALQAQGHDVEVINAGVSGDTTTGGIARLDWALGDNPDAVILELGANDGLRGIDPALTRANLDKMLEVLSEKQVPVLFTGMLAPPNFGQDYGAEFNAIYPDLAGQYDVIFYPFFLDGVATVAALNQADGIHPNPEGVAVIVENIMPSVLRLLDEIK
jgi:acyl-CoA thioesterase-1